MILLDAYGVGGGSEIMNVFLSPCDLYVVPLCAFAFIWSHARVLVCMMKQVRGFYLP